MRGTYGRAEARYEIDRITKALEDIEDFLKAEEDEERKLVAEELGQKIVDKLEADESGRRSRRRPGRQRRPGRRRMPRGHNG